MNSKLPEFIGTISDRARAGEFENITLHFLEK